MECCAALHRVLRSRLAVAVGRLSPQEIAQSAYGLSALGASDTWCKSRAAPEIRGVRAEEDRDRRLASVAVTVAGMGAGTPLAMLPSDGANALSACVAVECAKAAAFVCTSLEQLLSKDRPDAAAAKGASGGSHDRPGERGEGDKVVSTGDGDDADDDDDADGWVWSGVEAVCQRVYRAGVRVWHL